MSTARTHKEDFNMSEGLKKRGGSPERIKTNCRPSDKATKPTEQKENNMYQPLTEELREILDKHREWLELMNKDPLAVLTEEEMGLRADLGAFTMLRDYDFSYVTLSYALADGVDFSGCKFTKANLKGLHAPYAVFNDCLMVSANLREMYGKETSFVKANLTHADLSHSFLEEADFEGADLTDARLNGTHMNGARTSHTCLKGADFRFFFSGRNNLVASQIMRMAQ